MRNKRLTTFFGAIIFFITVASIVTIALSVYVFVSNHSGGKGVVTVVMLLTIMFLALIATVIDLIRRRITVDRPVEMILSATEKIASGDFSVRLEPEHSYGSYDQYDMIMENLNVMAAELGKNEIMKNDFISNVSHELKTPLAVIQNYTVLLKNSKLSDVERESHLKTIFDASKKLTELVTNILKLNKLENGSIRPEFEKVMLHELLAESVLGFESVIEKKNIELVCDFDEVTVFTSPSLLEIVFNNLISNATKFTEQGGRIAVTLKNGNGKCVVSVADSGPGISTEAGAKIFEKFYQADTSHSSEGNGLGLALVKKVIDIIGVEITVKSELGKGSTFTVIIKQNEYEK